MQVDQSLVERVAALHIVFDGPPSHESGRFVECETPDGRSVNAGEWHERADGLWELRITRAAIAATEIEHLQSQVTAGEVAWDALKAITLTTDDWSAEDLREIARAALSNPPSGEVSK